MQEKTDRPIKSRFLRLTGRLSPELVTELEADVQSWADRRLDSGYLASLFSQDAWNKYTTRDRSGDIVCLSLDTYGMSNRGRRTIVCSTWMRRENVNQ
jgi:hypothetical protein